MNDRPHRPEGMLGHWISAWGHPAVAVVALLVGFALATSALLDAERSVEPVAAVAFAIAGAALLSLAVLATSEQGALALLRRAGLLQTVPLPFFRAELRDPESLERLRRPWRPVVLPILLLSLAIGLPLLALFGKQPQFHSGTLTLGIGETAEHYRAPAGTDARLREHLGARVTVVGLATAGDGTVVARLRFNDLIRPAGATIDLRAGESVRVRGHRIGLKALSIGDRVGLVHLELAFPERPAMQTRVVPGTRTDLDGISIEVVRATFARLGALGPAAHIRVFEGETLLRDAWVHLHDEGFDARHAAQPPALSLSAVDPARNVTLSVSREPAIPVMSVLAALGAAWIFLFGWLLARPRVLVRGRDGDWSILVIGGWVVPERFAEALLDPAQRDSWRALPGVSSAWMKEEE